MKGRKKVTRVVLVLGIGLILYAAQSRGWLHQAQSYAEQTQPGLYTVTEFIDGDTIVVNMNGSSEKVRLIGVDTPETHDPRKPVQCFGTAAAAFTKKLIGANDVRLQADPLNSNRDKYNRLLRYVYLPDGTLANAEIIKQGYGFAYTAFPFTMTEDFTAFERQARQNNTGLWGACPLVTNQYGGTSTEAAPAGL
jgi:endonuclease YncB( thermonuclease family)